MEGGLREKGHLENQGGVVSLQLEKLKQPADAGHRLEQPDVATQSWEEEGKVQPKQHGVALSADSFCAACRKLSCGELVLSLGLKQVLGKRGLQERGGVWGAVEHTVCRDN